MRKILTIAGLTFREMIREKLVMVIAVLAIFLTGVGLLLGQMSFAEQERILADLGFAVTELSACALSLFVGAQLIAKEVERQTCLLLLSRPLSRTQFLLGKALGLAGLLLLLVMALQILIAILVGFRNTVMPALVIGSSIVLKSWILLAWAVMASIFVRPVLAAFSGVMIYLLGHWLGELEYFAGKSGEELFRQLAAAARWVTPNFDRFNWKSYFFIEHPPAGGDIMILTWHGGAWIFVLLVAASMLFRRKDIV